MKPSDPPYVVLDCETTGFSNSDRLVELSILTLDGSTLETIDEYDTLINPLRDVGMESTSVHGLTASHLSAAPTFADIAQAVAVRLNGARLVAHNAPFDIRMIKNEFRRIDAHLSEGTPFCTYAAVRCNLARACASFGISVDDWHRALADARATADLFRRVYKDSEQEPRIARTSSASVDLPSSLEISVRTLRREALGIAKTALKRRTRSPWKDPKLRYRFAVNEALDDGVIDLQERRDLKAIADSLGLTDEDILQQHQVLLNRLLRASLADDVISAQEKELIGRTAESLQLPTPNFDTPEIHAPTMLSAGLVVCFSGSDGVMSQNELIALAFEIGLEVSPSVTLNTDLLVVASLATMSGKAKAARKKGVPIMESQEFVLLALNP